MLIRWNHKATIAAICLLPLGLATLAARAYLKALKVLSIESCALTYFGARIYCNPKDLIQSCILGFGVLEPDVSFAIERNLAPGDVFVDVGANIGYDSLLALWRVGPSGKVVAIEAAPRTFAMLQRNLSLNNNPTNVRAVNVAASDSYGKLNLFEISETNIGAATTLASRGGKLMGAIGAIPLTDILTDEEIGRVRLIKMDVEGAEPIILRHLLEQLAMYPKTMDLIVEASPADNFGVWQDVFTRLRAAGFMAYEIPNSYGIESYIARQQQLPLRLIETVPEKQQDIFFTRRLDAPLQASLMDI